MCRSIMDIQEILVSLGMECYLKTFTDNQLDFKALCDIDDFDMTGLIPEILYRIRLKKYIKDFKSRNTENDTIKDNNSRSFVNESIARSAPAIQSESIILIDAGKKNTSGKDISVVNEETFTEESFTEESFTEQSFSEDVSVVIEENCTEDASVVIKETIIVNDVPPAKRMRNQCRYLPKNYSLKEYLESTCKGNLMMDGYRKFGNLDSDRRKALVHYIIDGAMERQESMNAESFVVLSEAIVDLFPTESKTVYYCNNKAAKRNSSGKLVDHYRNCRKKIFKAKQELQENPKTSDTNAVSKTVQLKINWLKHSNEPWDQVLRYWKDTCSFRLEQRAASNVTIHDIMNKWPSLKHPLGFTLVS